MTTRESHDFWVVLEEEHAEEWERVLGNGCGRRLPVQSPVPGLAYLPGFKEPQRVFQLALDCMDPSEVQKIAARLAAKFGLSADQAEKEIRMAGIPIREEHISSVMVYRPQRWF